MRFPLFLPLVGAFTVSVLAEPPAKFDCTIRHWNDAFRKQRAHDYDTGYSTTKVAPSNIAWLRPGVNPAGRGTKGFVVLGSCSKGNVTSSTELRSLMTKLSKLGSDHGANAISYEKSGAELRFQFLRMQDRFLDGARGPQQTNLSSQLR